MGMINEYIFRIDYTDDGDPIMCKTIEVDSIAEAKEVTRSLRDKSHHDVTWVGKGGKLVWTNTYVVDQIEVAIEASNDAWAKRRDEGTPEWAT